MLKLAVLDSGPEVFYTLQGEGVSCGIPAIFIRLSLCNLQCVWCDTPYTWLWNDKMRHNFAKPFKPGQEIVHMEISQILAEVAKYPQCQTIVITGGEPLLQQKNLIPLLSQLQEFRVEIETNGTIVPTEVDTWVAQYNVSPKLENSGNQKGKRDDPRAMKFFGASPKAWFKFVVEQEDDLCEVLSLINKYKIPKNRVGLMPECTTEEELRAKQQWLQEVCKDQGLRLYTRLHILLYGSQRGT